MQYYIFSSFSPMFLLEYPVLYVALWSMYCTNMFNMLTGAAFKSCTKISSSDVMLKHYQYIFYNSICNGKIRKN